MLILRSLIEGASNRVIALKLVMTESTVKGHMKVILRSSDCKIGPKRQSGPAIIQVSCFFLPENFWVSFGSTVEPDLRAVPDVESRRARALA